MSGDRMRRVDEAMREVLSRRDHVRAQGSAGRVRHRDRRRDITRSAPCARVTCPCSATDAVRAALARRAALGARLPAAARRRRAAPQAHADARVRLRRHASTAALRIEELLEREAEERVTVGRTAPRRRASRCSTTLRDADSFLLTTHEHPDGDAVGSLAAMQQVLARARQGRASRSWPRDEFPLPYEYRFIRPRRARHRAAGGPLPSARSCSWTAATSTARRPTRSSARTRRILNIDHHHDNTRFGTVNHVDAGRVVHGRDGVGPDEGPRRRADAARSPRRCTSALVTDTGRFMYENTGPRAHEMAAELIDGGIDVHAIYRRLYEGMPQGKLELLARGLTHVQRFDGGLLTRDPPDARGLRVRPAPTRATPRASSTTCARSRAPPWRGSCATCSATATLAARKVSLRATDDRVDVSRDRPRAGRRRAPARGRLLDRPRLPGAGRVPARPSSPEQL